MNADFLHKMRNNRTPEHVSLPIDSHGRDNGISDNHSIRSCRLYVPTTMLDFSSWIDYRILKFIRKSPSLRELDIADIAEPARVNKILPAVKENPNIQSIGLSLNQTNCSHTIDLLTTSKTLKCLRLSRNTHLSRDQKRQLVAAIAGPQCSLAELDLTNVDELYYYHFVPSILNAIPAQHSIKSINLNDNGKDAQIALRGLMGRTRSLKKLQLHSWRLNKHSYGELAPSMIRKDGNCTVHTLVFYNAISQQDHSCLFQLIARAKSLRTLRLSLGDKSAPGAWERLVDALAQNHSISSLFLAENGTTVPHIALVRVVQKCTWLVSLQLLIEQEETFVKVVHEIGSHPSLTDISFKSRTAYKPIQNLAPLVAALSKSSATSLTLKQSFNLSGGSEGAQQLATHLLSDKCTLTKLEMKGCQIKSAGMRTLVGTLQSNRTLESLVIRNRYNIRKEKDASIDPHWTNMLRRSMVANTKITHLDIPSLHLENDLRGILSFYITRNKRLALILALIRDGASSTLIPSMVEWLLSKFPREGLSMLLWLAPDVQQEHQSRIFNGGVVAHLKEEE